VVDVRADVRLADIRGVRYVEHLVSRRLALTPTDPFVGRQWYLTQSRFYESWLTYPAFESVPVAVIDSGVDGSHPELAGRILEARSFVGGSARVDRLGHGTFVSGLIAAEVDNGIGIAGLAPSAQLLVAKVVTSARSIPIVAEARAIRWAVERGARVINMSLGDCATPRRAGTASRGSKQMRSRTPCRTALSSWLQSETPTKRQRPRGASRAIRRRCLTCSE
jgi:subtilisin family serine protease